MDAFANTKILNGMIKNELHAVQRLVVKHHEVSLITTISAATPVLILQSFDHFFSAHRPKYVLCILFVFAFVI